MNPNTIAEMRMSYELATLGDRDVLANPIEQFRAWFEEVRLTNVMEANAMILSTVGPDGIPQSRAVLMKGFDSNGLVFYTNYESAKAQAIAANPMVCALFYWPSLHRQVRWTGEATRVSEEQSDEYFAMRPRGSQLGAWASDQSKPLASAAELHQRFEELEHSFADDEAIPRPENWGGYLVRPISIEFWQGRENRLHDRILFTRNDSDEWEISRLAP